MADTRPAATALALGVLASVAVACGGDEARSAGPGTSPPSSSVETAATAATPETAVTAVIDPGDGGRYRVDVDPADFSSVVDHPYYPLAPGSTWRYEDRGDDGLEVNTVEVLDEHRTVMGVETIVVHDVVATADGEVIEDTFDWFAQDADGNVWYFGEDTTAYDGGVATTEGSWEAGVDGALPGIVMPAHPEVSATGYRQEYLAGVAEDMGQIIAVEGSVTVPAGTFDDIVRTRDWTPLEPDVVEEKTYARDVGLVQETKPGDPGATVVLIEHHAGS